MTNHFLAEEEFHKALRKGRRQKSPWIPLRDHLLPEISRLVKNTTVRSEKYEGIQDVPVDKIIGSEDRSSDFVYGFFPRHPWMVSRWKQLYIFMTQSESVPPLLLLKFGGKFFVRDGHHRLSVAKALKREFISAEVKHLVVPLKLPDYYRNSDCRVYASKLAFHERTGIFSILDEDFFDVRKPGTWTLLEHEIFVNNKAWFKERFERDPEDNAELVDSWCKNLYTNVLNFIHTQSLGYLFPGYGETDIFVEFVTFWNSFPDPDGIWLKEAYRLFSEKAGKERFVRERMRLISTGIKELFESGEEAYARFRRFGQIDELLPEFELPDTSRNFVRFLHRQVFITYALHLKKKYQRAPYIQEITLSWYRMYYLPLRTSYLEAGGTEPFGEFYRKFSKHHFNEFMNDPDSLQNKFKTYCGLPA